MNKPQARSLPAFLWRRSKICRRRLSSGGSQGKARRQRNAGVTLGSVGPEKLLLLRRRSSKIHMINEVGLYLIKSQPQSPSPAGFKVPGRSTRVGSLMVLATRWSANEANGESVCLVLGGLISSLCMACGDTEGGTSDITLLLEPNSAKRSWRDLDTAYSMTKSVPKYLHQSKTPPR